MSSVNHIVVMEKDLDNFPCPTPEEIKLLLHSFDYFDKYRILFELMTLTGARIGEAVKAKLQEFTEDFSTWKYRIQKPTMTIKYSEKDKEYYTLIDYKVRTVQLPSWYAEKLRDYFEINKWSISAGYIFYNAHHEKPYVTPGQVRNILVKKRRQLNLNRYWKIVHKVMKNGEVKPQIWYCISNHSFRRFYVTELYEQFLNNGVDNALVLVGKILGHTKPMKTTSVYLSPRVAHERIPKVYDPDFMKQIEKAKPRKKSQTDYIHAVTT